MVARKAESVVIDIGGTNARFGHVDHTGRLSDVTILKCAEFDGVEAALAHFIKDKSYRFRNLSLAVACPVDGEYIQFTNNSWSFSKRDIFKRLNLERLLVINDFTAQSMASVALTSHDFNTLQHGTPSKTAPVLVIGPGTGLGVGGLVPDGNGSWIPLASEGGHVTLAGQTDREVAVIEEISGDLGHVSAERCVSGFGLVRIYNALCSIDGVAPRVGTPQEVVEDMTGDVLITEALDIFASFFGTVASDACLTLGARGGVVIAGGVVPRLGSRFAVDTFLDRFADKGRMSGYLSEIEVRVMLDTEAALLGLSQLDRVRGLDKYFSYR